MRPQILFPLFTDIASLKGIGAKYEKLVVKLCGDKVVDMLWHLPYSLVDRTYQPKIAAAADGRVATIKVRVVEHVPQKTKKQPYKVIVEDDSGQMIINFFKVYGDSIAKNLPVGAIRVISGKVESFNGMKQMTHPDYIARPEDAEKIAVIEPVYPLTAGITNRMAGRLAREALARVADFPEWLEPNFQKQQQFPAFREALIRAHFPKTMADIEPGSLCRSRLAYDELLANQLALAIVRQKVRKQPGRILQGDGHLRQQVLDNLGFDLTCAQKRVLEEINGDMASSFRMLRLLQGDVGSGKTVVALLTMLNAVECGAQAAIMAPTEILAKQHLETIRPLCEKIGIRAELLTGRVKGKGRKQILDDLAAGEIDIIIGTHALFVDGVTFKDLAYIVVDEQHRFGVRQRGMLAEKAENPHLLVMSATPIPRTLGLLIYGDLDISILDELPPGRTPVKTRCITGKRRRDLYRFLDSEIDKGRQVYLVCPAIEDVPDGGLNAVKTYYEDIAKALLPDRRVGLMHGKLKPKEKAAVMEDFKTGRLDALVSTTVIEVGVDVPNASVMVIENAERYGLSALHQLRGRVGRGAAESWCFLVSDNTAESVQKRLKFLCSTSDGFAVAQFDLETRGPGDFFGSRQHGLPTLQIADLMNDTRTLHAAQSEAVALLAEDPLLEHPDHALLAAQVQQMFEKAGAMN